VRLLLTGVVGGLFSALFGVGGGLIIVPMLILLVAFDERRAMATSLAAVGIVALAGTVAYALIGRVDVAHAALVGLPAAAGAVAGARVQQHVPRRALSFAFSGLLVVVAFLLILL
jgi:uncharacterized membrane protein YfcA